MGTSRCFAPGFPASRKPSVPRPQHNGPTEQKARAAGKKRTHAETFY